MRTQPVSEPPSPTSERPAMGRRSAILARRMPAGAEIVERGVHFRVWAPTRRSVQAVVEGRSEPIALVSDGEGYWAALGEGLGAGTRYRFRLDEDETLYPDPFSRHQPDGPHGPSEVTDPDSFAWSDWEWRGVDLEGQIIYELHVGTFSPTGDWKGAIDRLAHLKEVGVTVVEVMPVADFPGHFGWGYDGVELFAPYHGYGRPDDMKRFVNEAHRLGLAVILDVVYNHFGPDGNYLACFSQDYFSKVETEWGRAINYDGDNAVGARTLAIENAAYWVREFHMDGLRLDATQSIFDTSKEHVITALTRRAREAAPGRAIIVVAENEPQETALVRPPSEGGNGLDGLWNDDFHHTAVVAATGRTEAYYNPYRGSAQEFISAAKYGYLYQGQRYTWQKKRRGQPSRGIAPFRFVSCLENHDQVANSLRGTRLHALTSPASHRALTALLLLGPWTPMLFQGEEWNASSPFLYFADHNPELGGLVRKGRAEFLSQFPSCAAVDAQGLVPDPGKASTVERCRLRWDELGQAVHAQALALHRDLIRLRREDPTVAGVHAGNVRVDGAVLAPSCFVLRYFAGRETDDRLLVVNLSCTADLIDAPEPLLAPPVNGHWEPVWSSENPAYGGLGSVCPEDKGGGWTITGHSAYLLKPWEGRHE